MRAVNRIDTIERKLKIDGELEDGIFLFGVRQTGKGTFLREKKLKIFTFEKRFSHANEC